MPPTADCPPTSQPVHSDADFDHPTYPFAYVVNIPLIEMTPENGSTEIWLGTHINSGLHVQEGMHGDRASGRIKLDELEKRRAIRPPCQPVVPKGAIVLRDLRLWHAGIGNQTDQVRVMLAMSKFPSVAGAWPKLMDSSLCSLVPESDATGIFRKCAADYGEAGRSRGAG